jgi:adenylyl-sulfate kinase
MSAQTYWLFGISGAGKSTLAQAWQKQWKLQGKQVVLLEEEVLKLGINSDLNASAILKEEVTRRLAEISKLFNSNGLEVIVCAVTPLEVQRQLASQIIGAKHFKAIFVDAPIQICQRRDPKGLYVKALSGRMKFFPGVNASFEAPDVSCLKVNTDQSSVNNCLEFIFSKINSK